jgi:hypothetical protein
MSSNTYMPPWDGIVIAQDKAVMPGTAKWLHEAQPGADLVTFLPDERTMPLDMCEAVWRDSGFPSKIRMHPDDVHNIRRLFGRAVIRTKKQDIADAVRQTQEELWHVRRPREAERHTPGVLPGS